MIPVLVRESFFEVWLDMAQEMRACGVGVGWLGRGSGQIKVLKGSSGEQCLKLT